MKLACNKMNRYWKKTDDSNIHCIAMVLHPGLKLQYFHLQNREDEWIEAAENLTREEYIDHYRNKVLLPHTQQDLKILSSCCDHCISDY
ncbi:hypothetical protein J3R82DRAFT_9859 [Butyriboletus roseoflavus]|nr:hypothetical protein J3R82DRAFT_9859 [Butyriboletus roseoflavus]